MAEKNDEVKDKPVKNPKEPARSDQTKPATEFEYRDVNEQSRKVLKKGEAPLQGQERSNSAAAALELKSKPRKKRNSLQDDGSTPLSFVSQGGENSTVELRHKEEEKPNEEALWNEIQKLVAVFEGIEADYIKKFQDKLSNLHSVWEDKLRRLMEQNVEHEEEVDMKLQANSKGASNSAEASSLNDQVSNLRVRLSQKEKECCMLKKELERAKESQLREAKKNLSEKEVTEANLSGVESVLYLCATLKRKDHHRSEQDDIRTRIIMTMKRIQRLKLGQLWHGWTM